MRALVFVLVSIAGCAPGKSVLTLDVVADPMLPNVGTVAVTVTDGRHTPPRTATASETVNGSIPPARQFSFVLPADVSGSVTVDVNALDGTRTLASASKQVTVHPSQATTLQLSLVVGPGGTGTELGDACTVSPCSPLLESCSPGVTGLDFPDGYCTTPCDSGQHESNCTAAGGNCQYVQGARLCLARCNPSAGSNCRGGYSCCDTNGHTTAAGWCAPTASSLCNP